MATNNRGGTRSGNRGPSGKNNNPEGHNQYSGWMDSARERPFTAAAAVGGAVAAGVFLWSRRNQISDQIAGLSDQLSEWREGLGANSSITADDKDQDESFIARPSRRGARKSQSGIAEDALTLSETGKSARHPSDPQVERQTKVSAVAY